MKINARFSAKDIIGYIISIFLVLLILKNIHIEHFLKIVSKAKFDVFFTCILIHIFQTVILSKRWQLMFETKNNRRRYNAFASYWLGNFYNNLLPGRLGDFIKVRHFCIKHGFSYKLGFAALITEKVFDAQVLGLFALTYLLFFKLNVDLINLTALSVLALLIATDITLVILIKYKKLAKKLIMFIPISSARTWIFRLYILFVFRIKDILYTSKRIPFLFVGLGLFSISMITVYLLMVASGLDPYFGDVSTCISIPVFFLIIHFIPSAPSSVGVIHYGIYKAFMFLAEVKGIKVSAELESQIILSSFLFHLVYFLPETFIGFFYMIRERSVLFRIQREEQVT